MRGVLACTPLGRRGGFQLNWINWWINSTNQFIKFNWRPIHLSIHLCIHPSVYPSSTHSSIRLNYLKQNKTKRAKSNHTVQWCHQMPPLCLSEENKTSREEIFCKNCQESAFQLLNGGFGLFSLLVCAARPVTVDRPVSLLVTGRSGRLQQHESRKLPMLTMFPESILQPSLCNTFGAVALLVKRIKSAQAKQRLF